MNFLEQLNESQRNAVEYCDGPQLVIAGAGSGKTRVLTYKIAYLLKCKGLMSWNILALTFTNKAAREMKERITNIVGDNDARYINMGTFHSVFSRILHTEAAHIGYDSNFTIYDQSDSRSLIKSIIKDMKLDDKVYKPSTVADTISMSKNKLISAQQYASNAQLVQADVMRKMPELRNIYLKYAERCKTSNAMDFDDLLLNTFKLLSSNEEIRAKYSQRFTYILVDEYQDTNFAQQAIVTLLAKDHRRICVVGDDAQSIYSFRGANIDNILKFNDIYPEAKLYKLEQNYRSTQNIVMAANSLIKHNQYQIPKNVYSKKESGNKLVLKPAYSDKEEAMIVCRDIKRLRRSEDFRWNDFAILYRTNSQSRSFEEYMRKEAIPYRIYGGLSFYQHKEIKDIIAYYRVVSNPNDEEAIKRIINYPTRGIGDTTLSKIVQTATDHGVSLWQVISQSALYPINVSKATLNKIESFKLLIEGWINRAATDDAYTLGYDIIKESGISKEIYSGKEPEDLSRQQNVEEFLSGMQDFVESRKEEDMVDHIYMADFLQEIALLTDVDSDNNGEDDAKVVLMTIHSAKGLEFPVVFIVGLEENIFPSPMSCNTARELEEERRLLYVAITRAEKHCFLTCAQNRFRYGRVEFDSPSRFIKEIDPRLMTVESAGKESTNSYSSNSGMRSSAYGQSNERFGQRSNTFSSRPQEQVRPQATPRFGGIIGDGRLKPLSSTTRMSAPSSAGSNDSLAVGSVIEHQRFGIGRVLNIEGTGENKKATVEFRVAGTKQLLLKFAKYKVIQQ